MRAALRCTLPLDVLGSVPRLINTTAAGVISCASSTAAGTRWSKAEGSAPPRLSTAVITSLTTTQIGYILPAQIPGLTINQLDWLSTTNIAAMTPLQLGALTPTQVDSL